MKTKVIKLSLLLEKIPTVNTVYDQAEIVLPLKTPSFIEIRKWGKSLLSFSQ